MLIQFAVDEFFRRPATNAPIKGSPRIKKANRGIIDRDVS